MSVSSHDRSRSPSRPVDLNPYAAPLTDEAVIAQLVDEQTMWRDGPTLVAAPQAVLPNRCVKCNAPAERRLIRKLYWHHPAYYLLVIVSLLIYVIIALLVRQKAVIDIGLCARHYAARLRSIILCWLILSVCIAGFVLGIQFGRECPWLVWATLLVFVGDLVFAALISRLIVPTRIDDQYVWLKNLHPDYLAEFPLVTR